MKRYEDRSQDKKGEPKLPLNIIIEERIFEKLFKYALEVFLTKKSIDHTYLLEVNQELKKNATHGFERVDFEYSEDNQKAMDEMLTEIWKRFLPIMRVTVRRYNRDFIKKPL